MSGIAVGVLVGLAAALATSRLMQALLYRVAWNHALTNAALATGLFGVALIASGLRARRAARLDPTPALRRG